MTSQEKMAKLKGTLRCHRCGMWFGSNGHGSIECRLVIERDQAREQIAEARAFIRGGCTLPAEDDRDPLDVILALLDPAAS